MLKEGTLQASKRRSAGGQGAAGGAPAPDLDQMGEPDLWQGIVRMLQAARTKLGARGLGCHPSSAVDTARVSVQNAAHRKRARNLFMFSESSSNVQVNLSAHPCCLNFI